MGNRFNEAAAKVPRKNKHDRPHSSDTSLASMKPRQKYRGKIVDEHPIASDAVGFNEAAAKVPRKKCVGGILRKEEARLQ